MGRLLIKPGVDLGTELAPGGAQILNALRTVVRRFDFDVTITSFRDGQHSANSKHYTGEAIDLRTKTLTMPQKERLLNELRHELYQVPRRFYFFLEDAGGPNEHIHGQVRAGTTYTALDFLQNL